MDVLHPTSGDGDHCKLLDLFVDAELTMQSAIDDTAPRVHLRVAAILRTRAHYASTDLITGVSLASSSSRSSASDSTSRASSAARRASSTAIT